jgi:rSAM/selenodomain-associated transferase 1
MSLQRHLVVFVKAPRRGQVKTRLGRGIGAGAATAFYRQQTAMLLRRLDVPQRWRLWLAVTPDIDRHARFWPLRLRRFAQGGGDLGRRMQHGFDILPRGPVVLVGSDIPEVTSAHIATAFQALGDHDAVFGPATDGGYWLVGLRRRPRVPAAFSGVRWSSPNALADTLRNLAGYRVALIEELSDVDTPEDYWRWREKMNHRGAETQRNE